MRLGWAHDAPYTNQPAVWRGDRSGAPIDPSALDGFRFEIWAYNFDELCDDDGFWT